MGQLRIIGGQWKRTPIPVHDHPGLRPTPDRVRETLFNWLGQSIPGWTCLDLFAGAGSLGLEAASRGAASVLMIEPDPKACAAIRAMVKKLGADDQIGVIQGRAETSIPRHARFDLIFLDPPFGLGMVDRTLPLALQHLVPGGFLYIETDHELTPGWAQEHHLERLRADKAGMVHYHLFQSPNAREGVHDVESCLPRNL
jgi:16S rRNA (guanine(966)-N(2))-methyltransferase RsmD